MSERSFRFRRRTPRSHIDGKRAYELARAGAKVDMPEREVTIYSIEVSRYAPPLVDLEITCSTGTYIRSLARDIGRDLETFAYCHSLRRICSGSFDLDQAVTIEELEDRMKRELWSEIALPADVTVQSFPRIELTSNQMERWYHGQSLPGFSGAGVAETEGSVRIYGADEPLRRHR